MDFAYTNTMIVACAGIFGFFILLFGFLLLMRYLNYREKVKLAEYGLTNADFPERKPGKGLLVWGWIFSIIGLLGTLATWVLGLYFSGSGSYYSFPAGLNPLMLICLLPLLLGLILLFSYVVRIPGYKKKKPRRETGQPVEKKVAEQAQVDPFIDSSGDPEP